jgi:Flp pilus assembly protein TadB
MPQPTTERRGADRRQSLRRREDRQAAARTALAAVVSICGGLAALYLFLAAIGAVDVDQALVATGVAAALGIVWFAFFLWRMRGGGGVVGRVQRPDRERRGF